VTDRIDSLDMWGAAAGLPEQVARAAAAAREIEHLPNHEDIENVVWLGMGGSGIAGDVLTVIAGPFMSVPIVVHKGYGIPNFIGDNTLVFAVSFSGNTEETLEGATEAVMAGGRVITVSCGGELATLADEWGSPHIELASDVPMPRAAIGALSMPPMVVLEKMGHFPGAGAWIGAAVEQLTRRRDQLVGDKSPARELARRIDRTMPLIYGGGGIGHVAALRWKNQFNENPKIPAFSQSMPEVCHNELAGWAQYGDVTRQVFHLVNLRHEFEHPQIGRRFDLVGEIMDEIVAGVDDVMAEGEGPLAQLFDLILFGDFVSLELAAQEGVDPGPIPVLEDLKHALIID
jgi:glucose/mannose-6-phosphate isomerase